MSIVDAVREPERSSPKKGIARWEPLISSISVRLFFLLLLLLDFVWFTAAFARLAFYGALQTVSLFSSSFGRSGLTSALVSIKRSSVCAVSLAVALFCPSFGVMIGCAYFLMYDQQGMEEVLPSSLKEQFSRLLASKSDRASDS